MHFTPMVPSVVVTKNVDCGPGVVAINITGGTGPYTYSTDNGANFVPFATANQSLVEIPSAGTYAIQVADDNGCVVTANPINLIEEATAEYNVVKQDNFCSGVNDGRITFDVTEPRGFSITFSIDGGNEFRTTKTFKSLAPGDYNTFIKMEKSGWRMYRTRACRYYSSSNTICSRCYGDPRDQLYQWCCQYRSYGHLRRSCSFVV